MNCRAASILLLALSLTACSGKRTLESVAQEPAFSDPAALLGTWGNPTLALRHLPGVLSFSAPNAFSLVVTEVAIADGPSGATHTPYRITVTGHFRVAGAQLVLTPVTALGPAQYLEAATYLFGLSQLGVPVTYALQVSPSQLRLSHAGTGTLVFSRQAPAGGV